ncbi:DUF418 domain-containing protein [Neobacillus drentensis]|uniref:DUF418 domain-containing protein n=1 Tax=Neobacillus drentensis TaxID=220684 RepID=UPI001F1933AD|nr:DUF418 domain-containing protein [Neobacillus drentensis]ULT57479.1 DUF418 domain-containing protein [Neobacillus drentensis]
MSAIGENERIDVLDYLRGFALLGIILVNIGTLLAANPPAAGTADAAYWKFLYLFIEGRFYTIFTFLFGVGFYLFIHRANTKGKKGQVLFVRRMMALLLFGFVHMQFHPGEALTLYAIAGLILLPFYKVTRSVNLLFGIVMLVVLGLFAAKIFMIIPFILLGIAAGQYQVFERITHHLKATAVFTVIMLGLALGGLIFQSQSAPNFIGSAWDEAISGPLHHFLSIGITIGPVVSAFYVGCIILLIQLPFFRKLLTPLKYYGRMAFTNYLVQTVLILAAGKMLHLQSHINYFQTFYICLAIYVIQLSYSTLWFRYFKFGPFEWVWRALTYLELPPMRK